MPTQAPKEVPGGPADATPAEPSQMTRLEQMRDRLASLSDEARSIRAQMPREFEPDVERIQQQMQRLGERLSELSGGLYQTALPKPVVHEALTQAQPQRQAATNNPTQTMSRTGGDEDTRVTRAAPDEVIMLGGSAKADSPWSDDSARALTRFYESGEAFLGYAREAAHAAVNAAKPHNPVPQAAAPAASYLRAVAPTGMQTGEQAEQQHETSPIEPSWLDQRLSEIAMRIEQSLAEINPENSLLTLGRRFDQLEARMSSALDGVATRADLKELRLAEAQIEEISTQLDQLRSQFARLDAIDAHLGTLATQLSDDRLTRLFANGMGSSRDAARLESISSQLATIAGQLSHERLADLISQNAGRGADLEEMATAAAEKAAARFADRETRETRETQTRDIGEVRGLLESLINERRHSDDNNASMLETMQQAIIRVLDRIDALEIAQQEANAPQQAAYAPVPMQPAEPEAPEHSREPQHARDEQPNYAAPQPPAYAPVDDEPPSRPPPSGMFTSPAQMQGTFTPPPPPQGMFTSSPFDLDAAFATDQDLAPSNYVMPDVSAQPIDVLRHDFIADAHRAKLKAASKVDNRLDPNLGRVGEISAPMDRGPSQKARKRRGFFRSPRVLMSILTILAVIPAALFFMPRTPRHDGAAIPAAADLAMPTMDEAPAAAATPGLATPPAAVPQDGEDSKPPADAAPAAPPAPAKQSQRMVPEAQPGTREFEDVGAPGPAPDAKTHRADSAALSPASSSPQEARLAFSQGRKVQVAPQVAPRPTPAALMEQRVIGQTGEVMPDATGSRLPPPTVGPYSLRLAAAQGDAAAQFEVASRIAEGRGADKDLKDAAQWYQRSASSGFAMSQFRLGALYERGAGVDKDIARAKVWYGRAAEQGNVKAMHNLAVLIVGQGGATPDYATAVKWFSEAAAHGLPDSQYNLAMLYQNGLGVPKDAMEAYKWLTLAARSGDAESKSRRDALKATMSADDQAAASIAAESFRGKPSNPMANDSHAAGQVWKRVRTNNG
jgi:localization factor PodJL